MATSTAPAASTTARRKRSWVSILTSYAARTYFFLIFLQVPLFRIPCRSGMCSTPIHVTSSQLIASEIFPVPVVKALLYPGAVLNGLVRNMTVPSWDNLLNIYNLTSVKEAPAVTDLQRLEVLAGSYFSVAGALVGISKTWEDEHVWNTSYNLGACQGRDPGKASEYRSCQGCICIPNNVDCPGLCISRL
ncbi:hypothetical protein OIU77_031393 [Salix suchowensis]|uniref:Uncharacterized protein n=1 Tax=Salix suchowensis TaxID=1278906 RepID=A0ABQ9BFC0_9ROSI|nr:hypothetical protein OIU77_031393 [Salix suchowensis]